MGLVFLLLGILHRPGTRAVVFRLDVFVTMAIDKRRRRIDAALLK
ncbi:MAG: hypothetical protein ABI305_10060 [Tepidiformaceae bacterium]